MVNWKFWPLVVILAAAPVNVQAQATAQPASTTAAAKANPLDKIVCKTEEVIGSRLGAKRVCMTAREWRDQEDENRAAVEGAQRNVDLCNDPSNC